MILSEKRITKALISLRIAQTGLRHCCLQTTEDRFSCVEAQIRAVIQGLHRLKKYFHLNMFLKGYPLEAKTAPRNWNQSVHISWARLPSFCHLGFISDSLIASKFHNESLVFFLWDISKQWRPRPDAECGSDQGLHCLLTECSIKIWIKWKLPPNNP